MRFSKTIFAVTLSFVLNFELQLRFLTRFLFISVKASAVHGLKKTSF